MPTADLTLPLQQLDWSYILKFYFILFHNFYPYFVIDIELNFAFIYCLILYFTVFPKSFILFLYFIMFVKRADIIS